MRYSQIKKRVKKIKARGYQKQIGCLCYFKIYELQEWKIYQAINAHDILYSKWEMNQLLDWLYEKNMRLLFLKVLEQKDYRQ